MSLFQRNTEAGTERQPEVPRVQIQGEDAIIPRSVDTPSGDDRVKLSPKTWG